jgi:REP element-mobilizing transposase RayT
LVALCLIFFRPVGTAHRNQITNRKLLVKRILKMANTYTQIHLHVVFAVKYRRGVIQSDWQEQLYRYITGIVQGCGHKVLAINGMQDHVHLFFGMRPTQALSELMKQVKGGSAKWINENHLVLGRFAWQEGYGAFSYSRSQKEAVIMYINQQKEHHKTRTFREEYQEMLRKFEVDYQEQFVFKDLE